MGHEAPGWHEWQCCDVMCMYEACMHACTYHGLHAGCVVYNRILPGNCHARGKNVHSAVLPLHQAHGGPWGPGRGDLRSAVERSNGNCDVCDTNRNRIGLDHQLGLDWIIRSDWIGAIGMDWIGAIGMDWIIKPLTGPRWVAIKQPRGSYICSLGGLPCTA